MADGLVLDQGWVERFRVVVRGDDQQAAGAEMGAGRGEDGEQIGFLRHVGDGVVDEDGVERLAEANGPHVSDVVGDAGIEPPRVCDHRFRKVHCCRVKLAGQVGQMMAAAGTEVEDAAFA